MPTMNLVDVRSKALAIEMLLSDVDRSELSAHVAEQLAKVDAKARELLDYLTPLLDPELDVTAAADKDPAFPAAVRKAMDAAMTTLMDGCVPNPAAILIVQAHNDQGETTGRLAASTIANPADLLRVTLRNVTDEV